MPTIRRVSVRVVTTALRIRRTGLPTVVASVDPFKSETLTNYEIGFKTTWNNMFRFNAAVYMEDWNNIQYSVVAAPRVRA
jgi:outer membrane receptor protein involved in Fe transport